MAFDPQSRPRRGMSDSSMHRESTSVRTEQQYPLPQSLEPHDGVKKYATPSVEDEHEEDRRSASMSSELHDGVANSGSQSGQEEQEGQQRARIPSPHPGEGSSPSSNERQPAAITHVSLDFIKQITQLVTKQVFEQLQQAGVIEDKVGPPNSEPVRAFDSVDGQVRASPMERDSSNDKPSSTPSPTLPTQRVYTPPSPNQGSKRAAAAEDSPPTSPGRSVPSSPTRDRTGVRFSNPRGPVGRDEAKSARPAAYRSFSNAELSTIDQKWGMLFDSERRPTSRLGQFLRGLANHIIEEFHPKNSIVIPPEKLAAFYSNHSVDSEAHSLVLIFKSQDFDRLSTLYQYLDCQHHLVQEGTDKKPIVPGLTPAGFANWMTLWILAYPDQEARRLEKVVLSLPIDADGQNVDRKPERLPKQISRHLLPNKEDQDARRTLKEAISAFGTSSRRKSSIMNSALPSERRMSSSQSKTRPIDIPQMKSPPRGTDRESPSYGLSPTDVPMGDDAVKIERERQPYTAQPGNGRVHNDNLSVPHTTRPGRASSASRGSRDLVVEQLPRQIRKQSSASSNQFIPPPRPGGARKVPSPPLYKYSHSNPGNLDTSIGYLPDQFAPPSGQGQPYSASSYTPSSRLPGAPSMDSRDRDRDRPRRDTLDRELLLPDSRRYEQDPPRGSRSRRSTLVDEQLRLPADTGSTREGDRHDRPHDNRDRDRGDRDRERDRNDVPSQIRTGPVLHQESRQEPKGSGPLLLPDEEYYRSGSGSTRNDKGGEYETERGKYYPRR